MNRRQFCHAGVASLVGLATAPRPALAAPGKMSGRVTIAEGVLGAPARLRQPSEKVSGLLVVAQAYGDDGPYDMSLFVQRWHQNQWSDLPPADNKFGDAYRSQAFDGIVDFTIVKSPTAVSFFLPYAAFPFRLDQPPPEIGVGHAVGQLRLLFRFFPFDKTLKRYVHKPDADTAFAADEHYVRSGAIRSARSFRGAEVSVFQWDLDKDEQL